jgi:hypothetical protein
MASSRKNDSGASETQRGAEGGQLQLGLDPVAVEVAKPERLVIESGRLGPLGPCDIEIRPLTVFIGQQGTGKSLLAQMLYFFRAFPSLAQYVLAQKAAEEPLDLQGKSLVKTVIDGLRSRDRSFANLTRPNLALTWHGEMAGPQGTSTYEELGFNSQFVARQVNARRRLLELANDAGDLTHPAPKSAIFVPTERLLYSQLMNPYAIRMLRSPLTLELFSDWVDLAGRLQSQWPGEQPDTAEGQWVQQRLMGAMGGVTRRRGSAWKWEFTDGEETCQIDLDMASSGQRANWHLSLLSQCLFSWRKSNSISRTFTLYVEEPEIHLHPAAEQTVVEVMAFLVNHGFRVVLTTHSLTVLYALNNLLEASRLAGDDASEQFPENQVRLPPSQVAAYHLGGGQVTSLMDQESGLINEESLGHVSDRLSMQMSSMQLRVSESMSPRTPKK